MGWEGKWMSSHCGLFHRKLSFIAVWGFCCTDIHTCISQILVLDWTHVRGDQTELALKFCRFAFKSNAEEEKTVSLGGKSLCPESCFLLLEKLTTSTLLVVPIEQLMPLNSLLMNPRNQKT